MNSVSQEPSQQPQNISNFLENKKAFKYSVKVFFYSNNNNIYEGFIVWKNIVNNNAKVKISSRNLKLSQQSLKLDGQPLFLSRGTHRKVVRNHSTASTRNSSTSWTITLVHKLLLGILLLLVMMTQERRHVKRTALKLVLVFVVNLCLKLCSANWRAVVSVLIILLLQHRHQPPQFYHKKWAVTGLTCVIHPPTLTSVLWLRFLWGFKYNWSQSTGP